MAINKEQSRSLQVTLPKQLHEQLLSECKAFGVKPSFVVTQTLAWRYRFMQQTAVFDNELSNEPIPAFLLKDSHD